MIDLSVHPQYCSDKPVFSPSAPSAPPAPPAPPASFDGQPSLTEQYCVHPCLSV